MCMSGYTKCDGESGWPHDMRIDLERPSPLRCHPVPVSIRSEKMKSVSSVCIGGFSQPRLYILIIMYPRNALVTRGKKNLLYNIRVNQLFNEKPAKKFEKSWWYVWWFGANPLLLHPLSETKAVVQWKDEPGEGHERCCFPESFPLARAVGNCLQKKTSKKVLQKFGGYA